ncbi:MAG: GntR family transcriptional regulator [Desulfobacterales bacterium]|nr:GntR family transcriptional regulator [Desulfobacterales bacterium]
MIQPDSPLKIREQIKRQIQALINSGALEQDQMLPSARNLSAVLKINRNTVSQAYKELADRGVLRITVGTGTFVAQEPAPENRKALDRIFDDAVGRAGDLGFTTEEISDHFFNRLSALAGDVLPKEVAVVDCNREVVDYLSRAITDRFNVRTRGILIQDLESGPEAGIKILQDMDLIVCGFNHLGELRAAVPGPDINPGIVAVRLQVEARVVNILAQLPRDTRIGCVCANRRSAETLYNSTYFSGGRELRPVLAGCDDLSALEALLRECDMVFVTGFIFDKVKKLAGPDHKLVRVDLSVDSGSLDLVGEALYPGGLS